MLQRTRTLAFLTVLAGPLALAGCGDEGGAEELGETLDEAADDAGDALEGAAEEVGDAVDDATDGHDDTTDGH